MRKKLVFFLLIFFLFSGKIFASNKITVSLNKCVDGDTAYFNNGDEVIKTRFLAINTPESTTKKEAYGKEASNYTCKRLKEAKKIILEYDNNSDKLDKYDRHLVWVFVDDSLLQEELVSKGLAEIKYLYGDYKYTDKLKTKEDEAKKQKLNIWSDYKEDKTDTYIIILGVIVIIISLCTRKGRKTIRKELIKELKKKS